MRIKRAGVLTEITARRLAFYGVGKTRADLTQLIPELLNKFIISCFLKAGGHLQNDRYGVAISHKGSTYTSDLGYNFRRYGSGSGVELFNLICKVQQSNESIGLDDIVIKLYIVKMKLRGGVNNTVYWDSEFSKSSSE